MRPLHVAFFNRAYYPEISATAQLLTELAEGLANSHPCRVTVVCGVPQGACEEQPVPFTGRRLVQRGRLNNVLILRSRGTSFPKKIFLGRIFNYLTYFVSACLAGLQLERPVIVMALTDPPIIGLAAFLASRRFRCPLVLSYRDIFPEVSRLLGGSRRPVVEWVLDCVNRFLIRRSDRVCALGQAMRGRLIEEKGADPGRVVVIPDWADCAKIIPGAKKNPFSIEHGLDNRFVVMHAGNLGASQDLEVLLQAVALLKDLPDLLFVFVGEGVRKAELEALANKAGLSNVRFLPFQRKEKLTDTFASADCFVISLKAGLSGYIMPSKLYGVLAAGRPYVALVDEECDVARITGEHLCGLLAKPGSPSDLADKIRALYHDCPLAQQMGRNARQAALLFDRPRGVEAYFNLCQETASARQELSAS